VRLGLPVIEAVQYARAARLVPFIVLLHALLVSACGETGPSGENIDNMFATGGTDGAVLPTGGGGGTDGSPPATDCGDADCWTYLGYDQHSTYHNPNETKITVQNVAMLEPMWTTLTSGSATGTAAVVGDTVYFHASAGTQAFDRATGEQRWKINMGGSGSITWDAGKVYAQRFSGQVIRIDGATGVTPDWATVVAGNASVGTPIIVGNKVIVGTSSGDEVAGGTSSFRGSVVALDKDLGTILWRHYTVDPPSNGAAVWSSPSVDAELGMGFFTSGNNYSGPSSGQSDAIFALDLESGDMLWSFQATANDVWNATSGTGPDHDFGTNPILFEADGKKLVGAGAKSGIFYALERETGEMVWTKSITAGCAAGGILNNGAYDGTRIYVSSWACAGPAALVALDPATGMAVWSKNVPAQSWAPITVANGVLFVPANTTMQAFDASSGDLLFEYETEGSICSGAVVVDGQVFFGSGFPPSHIANFGGAKDGNVLHALSLP
jgi:polyvinyl alcohol dehydrogenase (cytochrome)